MAYTVLGSGNGDLDRRMAYFARRLADVASTDREGSGQLEHRMAAAEETFIDGFAATDDALGYVPVYQVWSRDGRLLHRSGGAPPTPMAGAPGVFRTRTFADHRWQTVAMTSKDNLVTVHIAERWNDRLLTHWLVIQDVGAVQLMAFAFCSVALWLSARRGFAPLEHLASQLSLRRPGELTMVRAERLYLETAPIVEELNGLLRRESRHLGNERSFLADAAHELRTPLASINTLAHLLVVCEDESSRHVAVTALQQGIDRTAHLIAQLLTFAKADAGPHAALAEEFDLACVVRERLAHFADVARARGLELSFEAPDRLQARFDRGGFISLLNNLVDNSIRYTPDGGCVLVLLAASTDGAIHLHVRDDGPGIPPNEMERVFERFYRLPGTVPSGSGLGLSIVRKIAESHSGTVSLTEGLAGRGLGVLIVLPATESTLQNRSGQ